MILALTEKLISFFLIMMAGFAVVRFGLLKAEDSRVISRVVVFVLLPCSVLRAFSIQWDTSTRDRLLACLASALVLNVAMIAFTVVLRKAFHLTRPEEASVIYSNAANIAIPLVTAMLGPEMVIYTSPFIAVQLFFVWSHGNYLLSGERKIRLRKAFLNINMIAVYTGVLFLLTGLKLPALATSTLDSLGGMVGPASMLATGMLMGSPGIRSHLKKPGLYRTMFLRLLVIPGCCLLCLKALSMLFFPAEIYKTVLLIVFLATMTPPANTITQLGQIYNHDPEYCGLIHIACMIASIGTIPILVWLYNLVI